MKYKILESETNLGLQDKINECLLSGWNLRNNIIVFKDVLIQQMVKCEAKHIPVKSKIEPNVKVGDFWYVTIGKKKFAELAMIGDITKKTVVLSFGDNRTTIDVKRYPKDYIDFLERKDK